MSPREAELERLVIKARKRLSGTLHDDLRCFCVRREDGDLDETSMGLDEAELIAEYRSELKEITAALASCGDQRGIRIYLARPLTGLSGLLVKTFWCLVVFYFLTKVGAVCVEHAP